MGTELCKAAMLRLEAKVHDLESELAALREVDDEEAPVYQMIAPPAVAVPVFKSSESVNLEAARLCQEDSRSLPDDEVDGHSLQVEASSRSTPQAEDLQEILKTVTDYMVEAKALQVEEMKRKPRLLQFGPQAVSTMAGQYRMLYEESDEEDD